MQERIINIDLSQCIGCALCQSDCPANNILITDQKANIKFQDCIKCGHCVAICPKSAVTITGFNEMPTELSKNITLDNQLLMEALRSRRSIRQFQDKPISPDIIDQIIEAGRLTPTAKNAQDVSYVVLSHEKNTLEKVAVNFFKKLQPWVGLFSRAAKNLKIDDNFFFKQAPIVIVVLSNNTINGSLAAANMALMAEANGLGVLYSGFFAFAANYSLTLRKVLGSDKNKAVTALVLGYPNVKYLRTTQKADASISYL